MSDALHDRVQAFIDGADASFDALACDIARHQAEHVAPVARLFEAQGVDAEGLMRAEDIPALPTDVFRLRRVGLRGGDDERVFHTSGTTADARGHHPMRRVDTYRHGALAWGRALLFPDATQLRTVALLTDEADAPGSSLTFMVARFGEVLGGDVSYHWDGAQLDVDGLRRRLRGVGPMLVAGTSFAFVMMLDAIAGTRIPLPEGSRVMQTGGFKGRTREVAPEVLRAQLAACFSLPPARVVAEYGMTELSSQLYQAGVRDGDLDVRYHAPPWLRVTAVDPVDLSPVPEGEVGLARFVDLANVDSAVAVLTMDRVRVTPRREGDLVELLGRQPGATPRGCSLALEPFMGPA